MTPFFTILVKSIDTIAHRQRVTSDKVEDSSVHKGVEKPYP